MQTKPASANNLLLADAADVFLASSGEKARSEPKARDACLAVENETRVCLGDQSRSSSVAMVDFPRRLKPRKTIHATGGLVCRARSSGAICPASRECFRLGTRSPAAIAPVNPFARALSSRNRNDSGRAGALCASPPATSGRNVLPTMGDYAKSAAD